MLSFPERDQTVAFAATWAPRPERTCQQTEPVNWRERRIWRREALGGDAGRFGNATRITVRFRVGAILSTKVPCKLEVEGVAPQKPWFQTTFPARMLLDLKVRRKRSRRA